MIDLTHKVYGRLTVLEYAYKDKHGHKRWKCQCSCNDKTIKIILGDSLISGLTKSCGCLCRERTSISNIGNTNVRKQYGESSKNRLFDRYKRNAKTRNMSFELTFDEFINLTQQNCFYCNCKPMQIAKVKHGFGEFIYNGIDRLDNNKGYILENCVSCCMLHNSMKGELSKDEFLKEIGLIHKYTTFNNIYCTANKKVNLYVPE